MTIPKGTEQWECDLIAPSAAPGLTMHDVFVTDLNAAVDAVAQHYEAACRAGGGDADDDFDAATLCFTLLHRHGVKLRALAAGQAHPQGRGEPVAQAVISTRDDSVITFYSPWEKIRPEDHSWVKSGAGRVVNLYAAPAASQAAPAAVAEPWRGWCDDCGQIPHREGCVNEDVPAPAPAEPPPEYTYSADGKMARIGPMPDEVIARLHTPAPDPAATAARVIGMRPDGRRLLNDAPAKEQEPDALLLALRSVSGYPPFINGAAADRIEQLQARLKINLADAVILHDEKGASPVAKWIIEIEAQRDALQAQHEADAARIAGLEAERDAYMNHFGELPAAIQKRLDAYHAAFLAKADARSDKGAG